MLKKICMFGMFMLSTQIAVAESYRSNGQNKLCQVVASKPELETQYRNKVISTYLSAPTWDIKYRYNAGHDLMVPLHYAYQEGDTNLQNMFNQHIEQFVNQGMTQTNVKQQFLYTIQYDFFLSRYVVLSKNREPQLSKYLYQELKFVWESPDINLKQKLLWKLDNAKFDGYARAVTDPEWYTLAIASDLLQVYPNDVMLLEIQSVAYHVFTQRSTFTADDGWLFDVGALDSHFDLSYIGYADGTNVSKPKPEKNTSWDSSHFFRMPLILKSLYEAKQLHEHKLFYGKLRQGLERQFFNHVLTYKNNKIALNNYMDGQNGLYRWGYYKPNQGIEPYGLTPSFGIGWWTFLPGSRIKTVYQKYYPQILADNATISSVVGEKKNIQNNQVSKKEIGGPLILAMREIDTFLAGKLSLE